MQIVWNKPPGGLPNGFLKKNYSAIRLLLTILFGLYSVTWTNIVCAIAHKTGK